jgi:arylsulfatase A-like enzyme
VRWAGRIKPGSTSDRVTGFEDWLPTLLELVGAKDSIPTGLDGISFAPTLLGQPQPERPFLYREFPGYGGQQCIRVGQWKAVRQNLIARGKPKPKAKVPNPAPLKTELYDLAADPTESTDVSAEHPEVVAKLEQLLREQHTPSQDFPIAVLDR